MNAFDDKSEDVNEKRFYSSDAVIIGKAKKGKKGTDGKAIKRFRDRRKNRLDARGFRADDEDGRWITTENGHKVHINEEGIPDKGNPHVTKYMGPDFKNAVEKIKQSKRYVFGISFTDEELKDGEFQTADEEFKSFKGKGSRTIVIDEFPEEIDEDFLQNYVGKILREYGAELKGKNVYLVDGDTHGMKYALGNDIESVIQVSPNGHKTDAEDMKGGHVLCKLFERGGEDEAKLSRGMEVNESATEKRYGEKRKQIYADRKEIPSYDTGELKEFNEKALKSIIEETGLSKEEATKLQGCLNDYFGGDHQTYLSYKHGEKKSEVDIIDKGLSRMGAYDGEIWRGMRFNDTTGGAEDIVAFMDLKVGDEIGMRTISSWTSGERVARQFAGLAGPVGSEGQSSVMLRCTKNKTSVGMQHVSRFRGSEKEVLAKSTTKWRITGKKIMTVYDYMMQNDKDWKKIVSGGYFEEWVKTAKSHNVILLDVEEI